MATKDVKHDGHRDRMRERILTSGISSLQSHEILEYLLYAFIPRKNTNDIAHALIEKFGSLSGVLNADAKALLEVEQARMALEDARNQKTKMRLRRDSQGNYTYQYVADEEKLGELQKALADAQNNLYNQDK